MSAPNIVSSTMSLGGLYPLKSAGLGLDKTYFPVVLAGLLGTAKVVDNHVFGFNGRILSVEFVGHGPRQYGLEGGYDYPSLDGTNLTGGVLALTTANCTAGAKVAASAITALNTFTPTSLFDLTLSAVTAFTEGSGVIIVTVVNDDERFVTAQQGMMFAP